ncbi:MAG: hypothetical protein HRT47_01045 [Candidatus Caenarcaniphilales bacterium]|nr:hypothetical protein [Candidatus Caenarcaniphilales bacterium]
MVKDSESKEMQYLNHYILENQDGKFTLLHKIAKEILRFNPRVFFTVSTETEKNNQEQLVELFKMSINLDGKDLELVPLS